MQGMRMKSHRNNFVNTPNRQFQRDRWAPKAILHPTVPLPIATAPNPELARVRAAAKAGPVKAKRKKTAGRARNKK